MKLLGLLCEIGGAATAVIGLVGLVEERVGAAMTIGGLGFFVAGMIVAGMGRSRTERANAALDRVRLRQADIVAELRRR